jgi:hypothetical protein
MALVRAWKRADAERVFARELKPLAPERRAEVAAALGAAASFATWESLRSHQGLAPEAARAAMARLLQGVLASRRSHVLPQARR